MNSNAESWQHQAGEIPGYTHEKRPVELVWSQETATREEALAAELQIKGWARSKKEALIRGDWKTIQRHAWGNGIRAGALTVDASPLDTSGRTAREPLRYLRQRTVSPPRSS